MRQLVILFIFLVSAVCIFVVRPETAFAQDNIMELELNVNAQNYGRKSLGNRIGAEFGLGMAGLLVGAGATVGDERSL